MSCHVEDGKRWKARLLPGLLCLSSLVISGCLVIGSPHGGDVVVGTITLSAGETDSNERYQNDLVSFYVDNALIGSDTAKPYTLSWDTRSLPDGGHTLVAKAYSLTQQKPIASSALKIYIRNTPSSDTTPPSGSVDINTATGFVGSRAVTLTLQATDDSGTVAQMQFSNDNVTYSAPEAYAPSAHWTLSNGDGLKTVYARFKDAASPTGNWSAAVSDTVNLDTTLPSSPGQPAEGIPPPDPDLDLYALKNYPVYWSNATDGESGISVYELQQAPSAGGPWTTVSNTIVSSPFQILNQRDGTYYYRVRAQNRAGLWSGYSAVSDGITIDTQPPQLSPIGVTNITPTSAHVTWTTNEPAFCSVLYGGGWTPSNYPTPQTTYGVTLAGLSEFTDYTITVRCFDLASNMTDAPPQTFRTALDAPLGAKPFDAEGVIFASWWQDEYASDNARQSMIRLAKTGADSIGIVGTWYMDMGTASDEASTANVILPHPQKTPTDTALIQAIRFAKSLGRRVFLKLHVRVILNNDPFGSWSDAWAGRIQPSNPSAWFASYRDFTVHYAQIAQTEGVEIFAFGTELPSMTVPQYAANWNAVIDAIKAVYTGKLTFSSNQPAEFNQITFWDRCDYLGIIGPYYSLTPINPPNPGLDAIVNGWRNTLEAGDLIQVFAQWSAQHGNKPVLFTELGYNSVDTATYQPWKGTQSWPENQALQKRAYDALVLALQKQPWFAGVFWWDWLTNPNAGTSGLERREYTPQNKLAEQSLKNFFRGVDSAAVAAIKIVDGDGNELPDGTQVAIGGHKNLYATATDAAGAPLGFVPAVWTKTGSGGTLTSNDVGYARVDAASAGTLQVSASLNGRTDSVTLTLSGSAAGLRVPSQYATIQAAAAVAQAGETILVAAGTYTGGILLPAGVSLLSEQGAPVTFINASGASYGVIGGQKVEGFTIQNASGPGIGRGDGGLNENTTKSILHNIIKNNNGHGIDLYRGGVVTIANNLILNNRTTEHGAGIRLDGSSQAIVVNNVISANQATSLNSQGGGIYISSSPDVIVRNNLIVSNSADLGGGVRSYGSPQPAIDYNDVWGNAGRAGAEDYYATTPGVGSLSADPQFVDAVAGNYHLQAASPAVNAGSPDPAYNDTNGTRNDMGAYGGPGGVW